MTTQHLDDNVAALVAALKTIRGEPTFWTDLGGRVYDRFYAASEWENLGEFPVLFVVAAGDESQLKDADHGLEDETRLRIFGWVREISEDPLVSSGRTSANKLRDDILLCIQKNLKLAGKITFPVRQHGYSLDWGIDSKYAAVCVLVGLPTRLFATNLGPQAI